MRQCNGWWWQWLLIRKYVLLAFECQPYQFASNLAEHKCICNENSKIKKCHWCQNMNSDVIQQWRTHMLPFQQGKDLIVVFGLVWFLVNEEQGKHESLRHYRIIMDIANQKALQELPHNMPKVVWLEKPCNAAMKNYSTLSNVEYEQPEQILVVALTFVACLLLQMKTVEKHLARAKPGPVQIWHTLLDAEGLSSRVTLKKDSIQCTVMMRVNHPWKWK